MAPYRLLDSVEGVEELLVESNEQPLVIFKHSTACPISTMAKSRLDRVLHQDTWSLPIYYLDLLRYRDVSNYIAAELGVTHQSPQVILVKSGKVVFHSSHLDINPMDLVSNAS